MISCKNISKTYIKKGFISTEKFEALQNVSIDIRDKEVFSIIGLNGAGKSTLISVVIGIIKPTSGSVEFGIQNYREEIGYMPEIVNFPLNLTPKSILNSMKFIYPQMNDKNINYWLDKVNLQNVTKKPLKTFSKGMLQRFNLVQCLAHDPQIVVLDEPFSGLDPIGRKVFFDTFIDLKNSGKTILFSSHILNDVEKISDKIAIIHKGKLIKVLNKGETGESGLTELFIKSIGYGSSV